MASLAAFGRGKQMFKQAEGSGNKLFAYNDVALGFNWVWDLLRMNVMEWLRDILLSYYSN